MKNLFLLNLIEATLPFVYTIIDEDTIIAILVWVSVLYFYNKRTLNDKPNN